MGAQLPIPVWVILQGKKSYLFITLVAATFFWHHPGGLLSHSGQPALSQLCDGSATQPGNKNSQTFTNRVTTE